MTERVFRLLVSDREQRGAVTDIAANFRDALLGVARPLTNIEGQDIPHILVLPGLSRVTNRLGYSSISTVNSAARQAGYLSTRALYAAALAGRDVVYLRNFIAVGYPDAEGEEFDPDPDDRLDYLYAVTPEATEGVAALADAVIKAHGEEGAEALAHVILAQIESRRAVPPVV